MRTALQLDPDTLAELEGAAGGAAPSQPGRPAGFQRGAGIAGLHREHR
jgi:hypothetical protein